MILNYHADFSHSFVCWRPTGLWPLWDGDIDGVLAHVAAVAPQAVPLQPVDDPQETQGVIAGLTWPVEHLNTNIRF